MRFFVVLAILALVCLSSVHSAQTVRARLAAKVLDPVNGHEGVPVGDENINTDENGKPVNVASGVPEFFIDNSETPADPTDESGLNAASARGMPTPGKATAAIPNHPKCIAKGGQCMMKNDCHGTVATGACTGVYMCCVGQPNAAAPAKPTTTTTAAPSVAQPAPVSDTVDPRSERTIATLHEKVRPYAKQLIRDAKAQGIEIRIISGLRTYAEQSALYAQGRTKKGPKVTNAAAGYSNHNFGIAFDIGVFKNGVYQPNSPLYNKVGPIGRKIGFEWGGDWTSITDLPHYQWRPQWAKGQSESKLLAGLRDRTARRKDMFAA